MHQREIAQGTRVRTHGRVYWTERILLDTGNGNRVRSKLVSREKYVKTTHAGRAKSSPVSEQAAC